MAIQRITPMYQWPKQLPVLTEDQKRAREDFMVHWHKVLPNKYGMIERFNHRGAFREAIQPGTRTLEIGAGLGAHIEFEDLSKQQYVANELRPEMAGEIKRRFPEVEVLVGDVQAGLPVESESFDRALAVHVLEHLPRLPDAIAEIRRVLKPTGFFQVVIPCEGSLAYTLARNISARRVFEKRNKMSYDFVVESEHVNLADEIVYALKKHFSIERRRFFPLGFVPIQTCNLVISLLCRPKTQ
ncbi:MAG TPA: methyltransferase domain-containing protein [Planctomycetota bacterium]|nr:methyltransferase domain-containing protein [Planctomycetota bacterium]